MNVPSQMMYLARVIQSVNRHPTDSETAATYRVERPPSHFVDGGMACSMSTYATVSVEADVARTSDTVRSIDPIVYLSSLPLVEK